MNFSTFLILLIILLLVGFAVRTIYKNKKEASKETSSKLY